MGQTSSASEHSQVVITFSTTVSLCYGWFSSEKKQIHVIFMQRRIHYKLSAFHNLSSIHEIHWWAMKWATARQNQQNDMSAQQRLRSAWASGSESLLDEQNILLVLSCWGSCLHCRFSKQQTGFVSSRMWMLQPVWTSLCVVSHVNASASVNITLCQLACECFNQCEHYFVSSRMWTLQPVWTSLCVVSHLNASTSVNITLCRLACECFNQCEHHFVSSCLWRLQPV